MFRSVTRRQDQPHQELARHRGSVPQV